MPEIRNLIRRFSYDEPYSKTCYKRVCVLGACRKVPYPCFGMQTKVVEIYSVAYYPDEATPEHKAAIAACAYASVQAALAACSAAYAAAVGATGGAAAILGGVAACIAAGEPAGRVAFDECKRKSLPHSIASRTGWKIEQKKFNRGEGYTIIEDNLAYDEAIRSEMYQQVIQHSNLFAQAQHYINPYEQSDENQSFNQQF